MGGADHYDDLCVVFCGLLVLAGAVLVGVGVGVGYWIWG